MHTIKGGWVGQTFALANCNESGGKKSRIRRSKEERKGMVESFIKKYQSLNNGNFPSLNLTHKEVGGSFYTVREIVREIIQENRVLGPGKLLLEEQHDDQLLEQYPLGTIAKEPQTSVPELPNGCPSLSNQLDSSSEALGLISEQLVESEQQGFDNKKIIDGSHAIGKSEESVKPKAAEVQVTEPLPADKREETGAVSRAKVVQTGDVLAEVQVAESLEKEKNAEAVAVPRAEVTQIEEVIVAEVQVTKPLETEKRVEGVAAARAKVTQMEDVIVETFPLPPVTKTADNLSGNSGEAREINGTFKENDADKVRLVPGHDPGNSISLPDRVNSLDAGSLVDDKEVKKPAGTLFGKCSDLVDEKAVENLSMRSSNTSIIKEGIERDTKVAVDVKVPLAHDDNTIAETQAVNSPKCIQTKSPDGNYTTVGSTQLMTKEAMIKDKALAQHGGGSQTESSPTLNRIHLESWGGVSKTPARSETNPLLAIFKSFVAAFLKFLSE